MRWWKYHPPAPSCWWYEELEELDEAHTQQKDQVLQEKRQEEHERFETY
jgi:hypothetical protein